MPFKREGFHPRTGKEILRRKSDKPEEVDLHPCGVCGDTGIVEDGQFCRACAKGVEMERVEKRLPKRSVPPNPTDDQKSAFDQPRPDQGTQLDLFDN